MTKKIKKVALEKFFILKPFDFWVKERRDAWKRGFLKKFEKLMNVIFGLMLCWDSLTSGHLHRASLAQKSRVLRVVLFQKLFKGYIFLVDMFYSYLPVKQIWRKSALWYYYIIDERKMCCYTTSRFLTFCPIMCHA